MNRISLQSTYKYTPVYNKSKICRTNRKLRVKVRAAGFELPHIPTLAESIEYINTLKHTNNKLEKSSLKAPDDVFSKIKPKQLQTGSYTRFITLLHSKTITEATVTQDEKVVKIKLKDGTEEVIVLPLAIGIVNMLEEYNVDVTMKYMKEADSSGFDPSGMPEQLQYALAFLEIFIISSMVLLFINMMRGNGAPGMKNFIGMNKEIELNKSTVTFEDIAGIDTAKQELMEIVDFLKTPEKYTVVGAKIPRGILLCGAPGVGKTLLARAIAGEANVPFFSCSGSDFIEMFVGVGASRVRDLFKKAREKAPCILFIDEIDTIGKQRTSGGPGMSNDERDQTINQLLTLMDGFEGNLGVIVIAATNRPDILDSALLRPGRFDRRVVVDLPDVNGRQEIFKIHTKNKPLDDEVNLTKMARVTVGFSGADINNLCNEAAIYAARSGNDKLTQQDFENALEKITLGEEKRNLLITEQKKRVLAYHEAGHALIGLIVNDFDIVRKVSIVPRGMTGGATYFEPLDEHLDMSLMTYEYLQNRIMVALGGRVAEEIIFGKNKITTGASGDLQMIQNIAREMVVNYGFNESLGLANWEDIDGISDVVFAEMKLLIDKLYVQTYYLLNKNIALLDVIANALIEKETLSYEDLFDLIEGVECPLDLDELTNMRSITSNDKNVLFDYDSDVD